VKKHFHGVKNAKLPDGPFEDAGNVIVAVEGASSFRALIRSGRVSELADPLGQLAGYVNEQFSGADYVQALRVRELLQKKMEELFDTFDLLVTVTQPVAATTLDTNLETQLAFPDPLGGIGNLCGLPALSVPCGFTEKNLPVGLQFMARAGDDVAVIQGARTYQLHTDWHRRHPTIV
jgi:aspartyl-tRNA(Asn)/glutamyl-tRNA(Gln) amidotransferase subunit A